jgi:hypothetical protein
MVGGGDVELDRMLDRSSLERVVEDRGILLHQPFERPEMLQSL